MLLRTLESIRIGRNYRWCCSLYAYILMKSSKPLDAFSVALSLKGSGSLTGIFFCLRIVTDGLTSFDDSSDTIFVAGKMIGWAGWVPRRLKFCRWLNCLWFCIWRLLSPSDILAPLCCVMKSWDVLDALNSWDGKTFWKLWSRGCLRNFNLLITHLTWWLRIALMRANWAITNDRRRAMDILFIEGNWKASINDSEHYTVWDAKYWRESSGSTSCEINVRVSWRSKIKSKQSRYSKNIPHEKSTRIYFRIESVPLPKGGDSGSSRNPLNWRREETATPFYFLKIGSLLRLLGGYVIGREYSSYFSGREPASYRYRHMKWVCCYRFMRRWMRCYCMSCER